MGMGAEQTRQHLKLTHGHAVRPSVRDVLALRVVHLHKHKHEAPTSAEEGAKARAQMGGQYEESRRGHGR